MEIYFDHEKLKVYQKAIDFINWSEIIFKKIEHKISKVDQLINNKNIIHKFILLFIILI